MTDSLANIFYTPSPSANENLLRAGVPDGTIVFVGNVMIDSPVGKRERLKRPEVWEEAKLKSGDYLVLSKHRPATVDAPSRVLELPEVFCGQTALQAVFSDARIADRLEGRANG